MKRRDFILTATGSAVATAMWSPHVHGARRDVSYEPDQPLESLGLSITDGNKLLAGGERDHVRPVLREEILDNPDAVFIIRAMLEPRRSPSGAWLPIPDQIERFGNRAASLIFRGGTERGGRTFIKPNLVGISGDAGAVDRVQGGIVAPQLVCGMVDTLRGMGSTNMAVSARGALRHPTVVSSGLGALFEKHDLPLIEAHLQYFRDYNKKDLLWHENPDGMIQRKFCTYKPAFQDGTTFINLAHAHTHKVGHTTLTLKNLQGVMPRGYGHICDAWTTLDMWRADLMDDFNRDYRPAVEASYLRHGAMGYKYWDQGDFYKSYLDMGGWDAFNDQYKRYRKSRGDKRQRELERLMDIADTRLFWCEIWAQRMMDIVQALPAPYVSMVDGLFSRGSSGVVHTDFLTVGRSMAAVDAVTSWCMGHDPRNIPYLRIAAERGIGNNDISTIPIYILDEKGVEKVKDYRFIPRYHCGIYNLGLSGYPPRFF